MKLRNPWTNVLIGVLVYGCSLPNEFPPPGETTGVEGSSTGTPTTGTSAVTEVSGTSKTSETGEASTTDAETTTGAPTGECDPWLQDCPDGYKCMAFTEEGMNFFSGNKCTPVVPNPGSAGDPCHVEGGWWTGVDDCDYGLACWDINHDTNEGICRALCTGSADNYSCPEKSQVCTFWVPGIAHICLETCDPLAQDCPAGQSCSPNWGTDGQEFVCKAEYSGDEGQEFDPCWASNTCDPGLICWSSTLATECDLASEGCCLPFCDLTDPTCNGAGAECLPFYDLIGGAAPPAYMNVGLCGLPR